MREISVSYVEMVRNKAKRSENENSNSRKGVKGICKRFARRSLFRVQKKLENVEPYFLMQNLKWHS